MRAWPPLTPLTPTPRFSRCLIASFGVHRIRLALVLGDLTLLWCMEASRCKTCNRHTNDNRAHAGCTGTSRNKVKPRWWTPNIVGPQHRDLHMKCPWARDTSSSSQGPIQHMGPRIRVGRVRGSPCGWAGRAWGPSFLILQILKIVWRALVIFVVPTRNQHEI